MDCNGLQVDLLGSTSWREAGDFFSRNLGFSVNSLEGGFEVVNGFDLVVEMGVAKEVEPAWGASRGGSEADLRVRLGLSKHRGSASPIPALRTPKGAEVVVTGEAEVTRGPAKRRKKSWVKSRAAGCYAVGEDIP